MNNLVGEKNNNEYQYPEYALILADEREIVQLTYEMLFMGQCLDSGERWAVYKAFDFEFPSAEELKHLKGIIFPGSKNAVYDENNAWIFPLKKLVKTIYEEYTHIKMVGICFGH